MFILSCAMSLNRLHQPKAAVCGLSNEGARVVPSNPVIITILVLKRI